MISAVEAVAVLPAFNPHAADFIERRYEIYRLYREHDPVHLGVPGRPSQMATWYLFCYEHMAELLRDKRLIREEHTLRPVQDEPDLPASVRCLRDVSAQWMMFRDPPNHTRLRNLVTRAFTPRMVEHLRAGIEALAHRLADTIEDAGRQPFDLIASYAYPIPLTVIAELMGIAEQDRPVFKRWSDTTLLGIDAAESMAVIEAAGEAAQEFSAFLRELIAHRRRHPGDDIISALIAAEVDDEQLSESELISMCVLLLIAGYETTVNLIGNGMHALLQHPDQLQLLRARPDLDASAVEELLRYHCPAQLTVRYASESMLVAGRRIERGDAVSFLLGAANRDPAVFAAPDQLDVQRNPCRHLAFSGGIHYCLGAGLARMEGQIALRTLLNRLPHLELLEPTATWRKSMLIGGLQHLWLESRPPA